MKSQNTMDDALKRSRTTVEKLATKGQSCFSFVIGSILRGRGYAGVHESYVYAASRWYKIYKSVMSEYMENREKLKKRMRDESLAQDTVAGNISRKRRERSDEGNQDKLHDDGAEK